VKSFSAHIFAAHIAARFAIAQEDAHTVCVLHQHMADAAISSEVLHGLAMAREALNDQHARRVQAFDRFAESITERLEE
jgi:hypothetical protein